MMRATCLLMMSMVLTQCKSSAETTATETAAEPVGEKAPSSSSQPDNSAVEASMETLHLLARLQHPATGAPKPFDVELRYTPRGVVSGSAMLEGTALTLSGVLRDNQFRVWVESGVEDESKVRRGYLIGELKGGEVSGTFAISGNGGTPSYRGVLKKK